LDGGLAHPEVLRSIDADHLGLANRGEPLTGLGRAQVVVELGDQDLERLAERVPLGQVSHGRPVQRRREQDRALDRRIGAVHERELGAERPTDEPPVRQVVELGVLDRGRDVVLLTDAALEHPAARATRRRRAAGVEPEHRDVREGGQPPGGLAEDVRVHVAAVRRQRVQGDQRRRRRAIRGYGELADQRESVRGVQLDVLAPRGQHGQGSDLDAHREEPSRAG